MAGDYGEIEVPVLGNTRQRGSLRVLGEKHQMESKRETEISFTAFSVLPKADLALGAPQREDEMRAF